MKTRLLLLLMSLSLIIKAQTIEISGTQTGLLDFDTVLVVGDVYVPANTVLSIDPGTRLIFNGYYSIEVEGGFEAVGSETDSIFFTVCDTTGFYRADSGDGGWNGLIFRECTSPVVLEYCNFSYGKAVEEPKAGGALRIFYVKDVNIDNCTFKNNFTRKRGGALFAEHSNLNINNCDIDGNIGYNYDGDIYMFGAGFDFLNCKVNMKDMYFHDNECGSCYGGGANFDSCEVNLDRAVFRNNYGVNGGGFGLKRCNHLKTSHLSNVLLYNNRAYHYGGAIAISLAAPVLQNFTIADNYCIAAGGGGLQLFNEAHPTFINSIIWGNEWDLESGGESKVFDGSQIWIWDYSCKLDFINCVLQFGINEIHNHDSITVYESMLEIDPMFIDTINGDYRFKAGSPCIDSGTSDTTGLFLPPYDLAGNPRVLNNRIDRGAFEFTGTGIHEVVTEESSLRILPNPLNDSGICEFSLDEQTNVTLKIYSLTGALVFEKNLGILNAGRQSVSLNDFISNVDKCQRMYMLEICTPVKSWNTKVIY